MKTRLIAKAFILNERGEVLLLRRSATDKTRPGGWDIPGGAVEPDEGIIEAMSRELAEETGLQLEPKSLALQYAAAAVYEGENAVRFCFVGHVGDPAVTLSFEHDQHRWVTLDEVLRLYDHPVWIGALRYLRQHGLLAAAP